MLEAGERPKAALLSAGGSRDTRACREGSQALTLGHWRWIVTLPGKLKRGGIINKSASMGLQKSCQKSSCQMLSKEQQQKGMNLQMPGHQPQTMEQPWEHEGGEGKTWQHRREAALCSQLQDRFPLGNYQALSEMIQAAQRSWQTALVSLSTVITHVSCPSRRV